MTSTKHSTDSHRNNLFTIHELISETVVTRDELTSDELTAINCIKLQLLLEERMKNVSENGFDAEEVTPETLEELALITLKIQEYAEALGITELVEQCDTALHSIVETDSNLEEIKSRRPVEKFDDPHKLLSVTWGTRSALKNVYVFEIKTVAEHLHR